MYKQCRSLNKEKQNRCQSLAISGKDVCKRHMDNPIILFDCKFHIHSIQYGPSQGIFEAIKLIANAQEEVTLSTYVLEGQGHAAKCLMGALLTTKAKSIRFLSNHYTFFSQKTLRHLGYFACVANDPIYAEKNMQVRVWKHNFYNSNHAKFVIVDNATCALGGYNFQESFFMDKDKAWRDLGITLTSADLARELTRYFDYIWEKADLVPCNTKLPKNNYVCPKQSTGQTMNIEKEIAHGVVLTQIPRQFYFHSHKSAAFRSIISCLELANVSIDILSPNVIDTCIWQLLSSKLLEISDFRVRIITNDRHNHSQSMAELHSNERPYFCKKKRKFKNLHIRFSNGNDADNKKQYLETDEKNWPILIDHSKYFNVDLQHFYIGSFNMDAISLHASGESGIIVEKEPILAKDINTFLFEECWRKAKEFSCN